MQLISPQFLVLKFKPIFLLGPESVRRYVKFFHSRLSLLEPLTPVE